MLLWGQTLTVKRADWEDVVHFFMFTQSDPEKNGTHPPMDDVRVILPPLKQALGQIDGELEVHLLSEDFGEQDAPDKYPVCVPGFYMPYGKEDDEATRAWATEVVKAMREALAGVAT